VTAEATGVLLDAVARSDGTRAGVLDELFRTSLPHGLTGSVRFDERGDIVAPADHHPAPPTSLPPRLPRCPAAPTRPALHRTTARAPTGSGS